MTRVQGDFFTMGDDQSDDSGVAGEATAKPKKERVTRPFPSCAFEEAESFARSMYNFGSGNPVRRLTFFDHIERSPESSASREIITNCGKYGLTKGSYKAELLELTTTAQTIFGERTSARERARSRVKLAIEEVPSFAALYQKLKELKLPARGALLDAAREISVPEDFLEEAIDTFVLNLKHVGLLQTLSGAERILTVEHMLDLLPAGSPAAPAASVGSATSDQPISGRNATQASFDNTCFYITPIGAEGSDFRKHSDLFLSHVVEPALEQFGLKVVRADQIGEPGIITRQVFDFIVKSKLVIADLSFHNPNVFYELAVRHMLKKPVVQITRIADPVPFDINQVRTIVIDNSDIYSLIPRLEIYKSEIATQARKALEGEASVDNPITAYFPNLTVSVT
jgi:hypothetical protein